MNREVSFLIGDHLIRRELPGADVELMTGVAWGDPWTLFTPAYWKVQAWMKQPSAGAKSRYASTGSVVHELGFCMLGGFGITAELAASAFERCVSAGLFERNESRPEIWTAVLSAPLIVKDRSVRYRYPNQKAKYLAGAMRYLSTHDLALDCGRHLRDQLLEISGVGYKTASWVARNYLDCDDVAILDVHLIRAGRLCGLFTAGDDVQRDYLSMEERFLEFCHGIGVRSAVLDCLIWDEMRSAGRLATDILARMEPQTAATMKRAKYPRRDLMDPLPFPA